MTWTLPILVFLLPLWVFTMGQLRDGHHVALMAAVPGILSLLARSWWLRAFCLMFGVALLWSLLTAAATPQPDELWAHKEAFRESMWLLVGVTVYVAAARGLAEPRTLAVALSALVVAECAVVALQSAGLDPVMPTLRAISTWYVQGFKMPNHLLGGTVGNPNFVSALVALAVPTGWLLGRWYAVAGAVIAAVFCVTQSTSTALFSIWAGLMVASWHAKEREVLLYAGLGAVGALFVFLVLDNGLLELVGSTKGPGARALTWKLTLAEWWRESPLLGHGAGTWPVWWQSQVGQGGIWWKWRYAHNEFLQLGFEHGLVAVAIVLGGLGQAMRGLWGKRGDCESTFLIGMVATGIVSCLGNFSMHLAPLALVILASLGLAERKGC